MRICGNQIPPSLLEISSYGINLSFTPLLTVVDISDARAEKVPVEVTVYTIHTIQLLDIHRIPGKNQSKGYIPLSRRSFTTGSDSLDSRLVDTSDASFRWFNYFL